MVPAPWCQPAAGHDLAVSGFNDQLKDLYRIVRVRWPLLYFPPFPADSGQIGHGPGRHAGGGVAESPSAGALVRWSA